MVYVQFSVYYMFVLHVHQCYINLVYLVYHQMKKEHYKPEIKCNYWPVLWFFNNWDIIPLSQKSTPYDAFDEIHQVVLDGISDNMASLFESVNYGDINTTDTETNGFYVIMFTSEAYTLHDNITTVGQIITSA